MNDIHPSEEGGRISSNAPANNIQFTNGTVKKQSKCAHLEHV